MHIQNFLACLSLPLALAAPADHFHKLPLYPWPSSRYPYEPSSGSSGLLASPTGTGISPSGTAPLSIAASSAVSGGVTPTGYSRSYGPTSAVSSQATSSPASSMNASIGSQYAASTTFSFIGGTLPSGLVIDTDLIGKPEPTLLNHKFEKKNVAFGDGFMELTVPGGQAGQETISSAEVRTDFTVLYGSVRTYAVLTEVPGVCNGMFFYRSDSQETDIEWISDRKSGSNVGGVRKMEYTNQPVDGGESTYSTGTPPSDATSTVHEYRLDWDRDSTMFYVDGVLQQTMTTNVPSEAGYWIWNNWVDGDPNFTAGPPTTDAVFKIQKIVMYYNPQ